MSKRTSIARETRLGLALTALLIGLLTYLLLPKITTAAPADLDTTFGTGGKQVHSLVSGDDTAFGVALQSDGKIVLAGRVYTSSRYWSAIARFNADGTIDPTFAFDGDTWTSIGTTRDESYAIAVQPDDKSLIAGFTDGGPRDDMSLIRFNTDGTLDGTFGPGTGMAYYWYGLHGTSNSQARDIALLPDGKILLAGSTNTGGTVDFAVVRANADGTLDSGFGTGGVVYTPMGSGNGGANAIAVQPDGKIVVAGYADLGAGDFDFALARYNSDGSLDSGFDGDGVQTTDFGSDDYVNSIAVRPDGTILAAGYSEPGSLEHSVIARYTAAGALDGSFGVGGAVHTYLPGGETRANALTLQNNDKFIVTGFFYDGTYTDYFVAQYGASGVLDTTFDGDGTFTTGNASDDEHGNAIIVQPDGKIVVAGTAQAGGLNDFSLLRLAGERQLVPAAPSTPSATITSPRRGKNRGKRLKRFAGTAGPAGEVAKVEIALRRIDRRALKKKRCLWLRDAKARFVTKKAKRKRCVSPRFLNAAGTDSWSYKLKRRIPKGSYELYVRVTLKNGAAHTTFTAANGNFRKFKVV